MAAWVLILTHALLLGATEGISQGVRPPSEAEGRITASGKFVPSSPAFIQKEATASSLPLTNLVGLIPSLLKEEGAGKYRLGSVSLDSKVRMLSFPAQVNMREGLLEYAVVTRGGKVHESLLVSDAQPLHIHLAALLLGIASTNRGISVPVQIEVEWRGNGPAKTAALEELIALRLGTPQGDFVGVLTSPCWEYTGSSVFQGRFEADAEGSILSLIGDPVALASRPSEVAPEGKPSPHVLVPNTAKLPPAGLALTVRIRPVERATNQVPSSRF